MSQYITAGQGLGQFPDFGKMMKKAKKTAKKVQKAGAVPLSMIGLGPTSPPPAGSPKPYSPVPTPGGVVDPMGMQMLYGEEKSNVPLYLAAGGGVLTLGLVALVLMKKKKK